MDFYQLSTHDHLYVLANVWDANSAKTAEFEGYPAIGTSSAAIAHSLGYEDGEAMTFDELLFVVRRILACSTLPLNVDIESGYGESADQIAGNIRTLIAMGVKGINIEDSKVLAGERKLESMVEFQQKLRNVIKLVGSQRREVFINVRTDTFLLGLDNAKEETLERAQHYANAGADGLFVPFISKPEDIKAAVDACALPLNVMCTPTLPEFGALQRLGVNRVSMGNYAHSFSQEALRRVFSEIRDSQSFIPLF
ncbi:putative carboxyvinyl-carboxyphosphonate phosphorylmutase [Grimontia indica]|uniref:Carboxyvinyl-carboxyphosphonate phosphorylmutase n=1 Tax=Grimontia indica TaxID=1056512 RepID=R1GXK0_9GAMM|nr:MULTISPECIES: isocitrate lyase/phosphoenolpyruvate mutase family protein [Grimontia]EOD80913.1 putative carboxyvinyl-carboxyphosphonate phosphorylmutase [Grimontia indica]